MNALFAKLVFMTAIAISTELHAQAQSAVWCVGESTKVKPADAPQDKNLTWDGATKTVRLGSARNEYVSFQIITRAINDDLQGVTVVPQSLKGASGAEVPLENIELFVEHYMDVKVTSRGSEKELFPYVTGGEHPTQMVPFSAKKFGAPFSIWPARNQPVWVDIYVPENAAPGDYRGTFIVKSGEIVLSELKIELSVWNFTLPHETHFRSFLYTGPENLRWAHRTGPDMDGPRFLQLENNYFQMAHQHRLNFNPNAGAAVQETGTRYLRYYDGSAFTERVGKGVGQNTLNMPPEGETEAAIKKSAKEIADFYESKKFPAFLFGYIWDEPSSDEDFATSKQRCKWVHEAAGKTLKTFIATPHWQRYDPGDVDIFTEPTISDIPKVIERGSQVWGVNQGYGAGPYLDSPGYGGRSIPWMHWKMNLGGWQFWDCCYWVDRQNLKHKKNGKWVRNMTHKQINEDPEAYLHDVWADPLNFDETRKKGYPARDAIRINGDGILFYPGYDVGIFGPVASYAMKSLRRGAQDYEYLWLLKQKGGMDAKIDAIVNSVCPAAGKWNDDPEAWDRARLLLAALLK